MQNDNSTIRSNDDSEWVPNEPIAMNIIWLQSCTLMMLNTHCKNKIKQAVNQIYTQHEKVAQLNSLAKLFSINAPELFDPLNGLPKDAVHELLDDVFASQHQFTIAQNDSGYQKQIASC